MLGVGIVLNDDEKAFIHDVGFLGKDVDEVDVIVHENTEEHIVVVFADFCEAVDVRGDIYSLGTDEDLDAEVERVEEVLVGKFDSFAFLATHEVEVDGLASDDGAERTVFHDDHTVAELGDETGGLGR